ncbi:MAG: hypothetical protein OIF57_06740 [Marinobacterium sp.]|nr:hypothetical protein [Marinobacterium sp.]
MPDVSIPGLLLQGGGDQIFAPYPGQKAPEPELITEAAMDAATADFADQQQRATGMAVALTFADGGEGNYTFDMLEVITEGCVTPEPGEGDSEELLRLDDDEVWLCEAIMESAAEAMIGLGADPVNVQAALKGDEQACQTLGGHLNAILESAPQTDDQLISEFAVRPSLITEGVVKKIVDGQVKYVRTNRRKRRMTAKQRAALKKARMKANTGAAKQARAKSMNKRKKLGL